MQQIPADMRANEDLMNTIIDSPDLQNAKIKSDKELEKIMALLFQSQTEIYKKFLEPDFQRRYKEFIFDTLWTQKNKQPPINP
jgi:hypothetical protein